MEANAQLREQYLAGIQKLHELTKHMPLPSEQPGRKASKPSTVPSKGKKLPKRPKINEGSVSDNREPREDGEVNNDDASADEASESVAAAVDDYLASDNSDAEDNDNNDSDSDSDPIEDKRKQIGEAESTGPPLPEKLANVITQMLKTKMAADTMKTTLANIKTPKNIPMLNVPLINAEIWANLSDFAHSRDKKLARTQKKLSKALALNAEMVAELTQLRESLNGSERKKVKTITAKALDAIQLGAAVNQDLNQQRRDRLRSEVQPTYKNLCNPPEEEAEKLFGKDLNERLKELKEVKKVTTVTKKSFLGGNRQKPYDSKDRYNKTEYRAQNYQHSRYPQNTYQRQPPWKSQWKNNYQTSGYQTSSKGGKGKRSENNQ